MSGSYEDNTYRKSAVCEKTERTVPKHTEDARYETVEKALERQTHEHCGCTEHFLGFKSKRNLRAV